MDDYERCMSKKDITKEETYCNDKCPHLCNQTVLSFDQVIVEERPVDDTMLTFQLSPIFTKHPVFTEVYPQSETAFWAALGK